MKTGATLSEVMNLFSAWLSSRNTVAALRLAATAVIYAGRRQDLNMLDVNIGSSKEAAAIRANAEFAVRRRTLR
jgi:hypothetical protein